jgi:hypothetical protein
VRGVRATRAGSRSHNPYHHRKRGGFRDVDLPELLTPYVRTLVKKVSALPMSQIDIRYPFTHRLGHGEAVTCCDIGLETQQQAAFGAQTAAKKAA